MDYIDKEISLVVTRINNTEKKLDTFVISLDIK